MLIKRGRVWQSRIMLAGFLHQKSLKTRDKQEALRREATLRLELTSGDFGLTAGKIPILHAFEERFFRRAQTQGQTTHTSLLQRRVEPIDG